MGEVSPCASKKRHTSELLPIAFSVPSTATTSFLRTPFVFPLPPRLTNVKYDILAQDAQMIFEWDENKNQLNKRKHGISFEEAARVFADPNLKIVLDPEETEIRWDAVGFVGKMLFVVFTERGQDCLRIISARKATKREINGYKNNDLRRN